MIGLKTAKGTKQLKLDPSIYESLQKEKVEVGDVIYIEANSGAVKVIIDQMCITITLHYKFKCWIRYFCRWQILHLFFLFQYVIGCWKMKLTLKMILIYCECHFKSMHVRLCIFLKQSLFRKFSDDINSIFLCSNIRSNNKNSVRWKCGKNPSI